MVRALMRPVLLAAQQRYATGTPAAALAAFASGFTGKQHDSSYGRGASALYAATAAVVGLGAASSTLMTSASADEATCPAPAQVPVDPYARPAEAKPLPSTVTMYQYEVCPYCCKVKAALDYYKIPYQIIEVNPLTKAELRWSTYRKVPVVKMGEEVVVDSSAIMSRLATDVEAAQAAASPSAKKPAATATASQASSGGSWLRGRADGKAAAPAPSLDEEVRWRKWVDERLVKVLTANIYRNWGESVETFKYITDQTGWGWGTREVARWTGAVMMWQIGKRMPAKYNITGDLRQALYDCCNEYVDALQGRPFMGGNKPNLADLAAFGVLRAVHKTGAFSDVMQHSRIAPWYERMQEAVGPSARLEA